MAIRKASAYSKKIVRPYTRNSRSKKKAFIKTIPYSKIVKYSSGDQKAFESGKHPFILRLVSEEKVQIRDNALESTRMYLTKILDKNALGQYFMRIRVKPHHFQRENKTAAGAGADRMSTGMTQSFGIVIGRAAIVNIGQEIIFVSCANEKVYKVARKGLEQIKSKLPCKSKIIFENLNIVKK